MAEPLNNELSRNSRGGTELLAERLYASLSSELLDRFQIWFSRFRQEQFDPSKKQIMYCHDLEADPEASVLSNGGWQRFDRIIFVSTWQMQRFCEFHQIPYSRCTVLLNSINPIEFDQKPTDKIRIGYWSTPHRGLQILVPVFDHLCNSHADIELDVFSSFSIYGWEERDKPFQQLFDQCRDHPQINYHGSVSNDQIRSYAASAHILAYPSIWSETSCLVLMEAMSAGMLCVHPNLAALPETAANWTMMYQFDEDLYRHAHKFCEKLDQAIDLIRSDQIIKARLRSQKQYADLFYNWEFRKNEWEQLLLSLV